jgi:hypothetical protein
MCIHTQCHINCSIDSRIQNDLSILPIDSPTMVCWPNMTALLDDLIKKIGDIFLPMDDLDYYGVFRAVCGGADACALKVHVTPMCGFDN